MINDFAPPLPASPNPSHPGTEDAHHHPANHQ